MVLASASGISFAADWRRLESVRAAGVTYNLDYNSISFAHGYRKAWLLTSYDSPQPGIAATSYRPFQSVITQDFYDCEGRQSTVAKLVFYAEAYAGGNTVGSVDMTAPFKSLSEVVPSSVGEGVLEEVCAAPITKQRHKKASM
ncbi:surface-adhesin E family protein [Burkholderia glumae]|uniref:surface-adhesin E family protein n=1 Tax=Burkholderia glumae TaxID=337 RepID=UPI0030B8ECCF